MYETVLSLLWKSEMTKGFEKDVKGALSSHGKKCIYQNVNAEKKKKPLKNNQSFKKSELKNDFDSHLPVFIQSIYFNHLIFFSHRFSSASLSPYSHLPSLCRMNIFSLFFFFFTLNWLCTSSPLWLPSFTNRTEIWVKMT